MTRAASLTVAGAALVLGGAAILAEANLRVPGDQQGYEPVQPIAYSHRLHAGELGLDCLYCHFAAETGRHAGVPPATVCMNCHRQVTTGLDALLAERRVAKEEGREPRRVVSEKLRPLYDALALDDAGDRDPARTPRPIPWVRVHRLPDHVAFSHAVHVQRGVACQSCHGPVQSMERVSQFASLSMGWCVECHRANARTGGVAVPPVAAAPADHVSIDCAVCHH